MEILDLKLFVKKRNYWRGLTTDWILQTKRSMNLKMNRQAIDWRKYLISLHVSDKGHVS